MASEGTIGAMGKIFRWSRSKNFFVYSPKPATQAGWSTIKVWARVVCVILTLLASVALHMPPRALAGTPYEAQIAGFIAAVLEVLITGEFSGRSPSQVDAALGRRVCGPGDYDDLRAAANNRAAFDAVRRRCKFVAIEVDQTHVHGTAHLPSGHCAVLKKAFEDTLVERVYRASSQWITIEYKGSRYESNRRHLAAGAKLLSACQHDGSLRVSAPRKRKINVIMGGWAMG